MTVCVTLVQGGGIGFDQVPAVKRILKASGVAIEWHEFLAGQPALEHGDRGLPEPMLDSVRKNGLALKTKLLSPTGGKPDGNWNVQFRERLGLFASVRPLKNIPGLGARFKDVDFLVIRELTEDLYRANEHEIVPGVVQSIKVVTEAACTRFFRFAFEWCRLAARKTLHCVHKANILKLADGLFLEVFRSISKDFPDIQTKEIIVDNCCMQMVLRPQQFDALVMGNLYGDLVSDLGAGIVGGIAATSGINVGAGIKVFETFHGGSRETIGVDRANPLPLLWSSLELLQAIGEGTVAAKIKKAAEDVLLAGVIRTSDLGGGSSTQEVAEAIIDRIRS